MHEAAERRARLEGMRKRAREVRERQEQEDKEQQDEGTREQTARHTEGEGAMQGSQGRAGEPGILGMHGHAGIPPVGRFLQTSNMAMSNLNAGDGGAPGYYAAFHLPSAGMNGNFEVETFSTETAGGAEGDGRPFHQPAPQRGTWQHGRGRGDSGFRGRGYHHRDDYGGGRGGGGRGGGGRGNWRGGGWRGGRGGEDRGEGGGGGGGGARPYYKSSFVEDPWAPLMKK